MAFNVLAAVFAGLIGTGVMTVLLYLAPSIGMTRVDIIGMLGTVFSPRRGLIPILGVIVHLAVGVVFAIVYALFWSAGVGVDIWYWGLIFGAAHGLIATIAIPLMMWIHPRPPETSGGLKMVGGLLLGHTIYGLIVAITYALF
jgi:uncharacterized membrane protein YagU involved in acid resistance